MRVLLVYCHPVPESFVAAVRDRALATLQAGGHDVRLTDLYAESFDPVLTADQRRAYHDAGTNEAGIERHLTDLKWCEALIFVYPTWWYGLPAMLKGWLDRVWVPHATFTMPSGNKPIGRVLTNIRVLGAISTLGSPWWWWVFVGMPGRRTLLSGLKPLLAPGCRTFWLGLHRMDLIGDEERRAFLDRIAARLSRL
jgi:putative NADPH-quinone reductase